MFIPLGIALDQAHGKLYVSQDGGHRVLRYRYPSSGFSSNNPAFEAVLGQPNSSPNGSGLSSTRMNSPHGLCVDSSGTLYVADFGNHRVVAFDNAYSLATGAAANRVLGQSSFTAGASDLTTSSMNSPFGLAIDGNDTLWVADCDNYRVLRFDNASAKANGANADGVLGQLDFSTASTATDQAHRIISRASPLLAKASSLPPSSATASPASTTPVSRPTAPTPTESSASPTSTRMAAPRPSPA